MKSRGSILIVTLLILSILLSTCVVVIKVVGSGARIAGMEFERKVAFYLAEAGFERAKVIMSSNANWFTDMPHSPSNDMVWLMGEAEGHREDLGSGNFKIVKESGKNILYCIGYFNGSGRKPAVAVLKVDYQPAPFKQLNWEIL
ncbi:hypothetical protein ACFLZ2_04150 [Candidatus Margulisiibacteriota bacterium]